VNLSLASGLLMLPLLLIPLPTARAAGDAAAEASAAIEHIDELLQQWQFAAARQRAEALLQRFPDLPAVQLEAAWVKFHFSEHRSAWQLAQRAVAALGPQVRRNRRLEMIEAAAEITAGYRSRRSPQGRVVVRFRPGVDEILVPLLFDTVERTLEVVGRDLGYRLPHPVLVELLPGEQALARLTGLPVEAIRTSGTIAVCKYGRLLVTSPRVTLKGYGWLDTASHELVHMIISEKTRNRTPIWIHEALARYEQDRWRAAEPLYRPGLEPLAASALARAIRDNRLITFEQMHPSMALLPSREATELAFAEVYQAAAFLRQRFGYPAIRRLLEGLGDGLNDSAALAAATGMNLDKFVASWMSWMKRLKLQPLAGSPALESTRPRAAGSTERALGARRNVDLRDRLHLGELLRARGRLPASLVEYQRAVRQAGPRHAALWLLSDKLGVALLAAGRTDQARQAFADSLRINPRDLEAHLHLGRLLLERDPHLAWLHLRECERINPLDPRVQRGLLAASQRLEKAGSHPGDWRSRVRRHRRALELLAGSRQPGPTGKKRSGDGASADTAWLTIHTTPWARVWLDWQDSGLTTPVYRLALPAGTHSLGLQADCLPRPLVVVISLAAGEEKLIERQLCEKSE